MKILLTLALLVGSAAAQTMTGVSFGTAYRYNQGYPTKYTIGDTEFPTWGSDGNTYTFIDGSFGLQDGLTGGRNLMSTYLNGYTSSMTITMTNSMDAWGTDDQTGSDGKVYRSSGMISVGGDLYIWLTRNTDSSPYTQSTAQLIESTDLGVTWTPAPPSTAQPYSSPMFTGTTFSAPAFVQYGENYSCPGIDGCSTYVYAVSNFCGQTNSCSDLYIGRVAIANIGNLSASDWTFYQSDGSWGSSSTAASILHSANHLSLAQVQYIPAANLYLMIEWCWNNACSGGGINSNDTEWYFYYAQHPWGPWTLFQTTEWTPQGYYGPAVIPASVSGNTATLIVTGDFDMQDRQTGLYTPTLLPITMTFSNGTSVGSGTKVTSGTKIQ